jgi:hypothetical protein
MEQERSISASEIHRSHKKLRDGHHIDKESEKDKVLRPGVP